jgi:hypothetical protein
METLPFLGCRTVRVVARIKISETSALRTVYAPHRGGVHGRPKA